MSELECRPIIILGPERSGTSVVAEMVHRWGAYVGEPEMIRGPDQNNLRGYWEYTPIWDFLVDLGDLRRGASWWDESFQDLVCRRALESRFRDEALKMVSTMQAGRKHWMWKDPALSFFLPFWMQIWGEATYLITVRNPMDIALSWRDFVSPSGHGAREIIEANLLRWQYIMSLVLANTEGVPDKLFVSYEELMRDPHDQAARLSRFLEQSCGTRSPESGGTVEMAAATDPDLWHNRTHVPFEQDPMATEQQKALYRMLGRKVSDPTERFSAADFPMPDGWRDLVKKAEARGERT